MILAIDGYEANSEGRVGVGRYAFELVRQIAKRQKNEQPPFDEVRVYVPESPRPHMPQESERFRYEVVVPKQLWTFIGLPTALSLSSPKADVVFSPTHYIPRWVNTPRVCAIMDISYLKYPDLFLASDLHKLVGWTAYSVRHAAKIITISQCSKDAIIDAYRVPESNVVVAYPALTDIEDRKRMGTSATNNLPKRYILSVGTLQPRKNFVRLIEAFSKLADRDVALVVVGKKGWLYEDILKAPRSFGVSDRVYFLDYVSDGELPALYRNARCFALPSLYEGFGLPVLEAMAYGVPVVVSKGSSLPEIAGDAGIYVDPEDVTSIAKGLSHALTLTANERSKRIKEGRLRAKSFSWDKAAEKVIDVLTEVGKGNA